MFCFYTALQRHRCHGRHREDQNESIVMVLLNTVVAVCGSLELGSCVGYTAPTQSPIVFYLNLLVAE
ncbi:hypothetical protein L6452_02524 [Arctium lappa]|uniref:Uncharacterized protein n=1 Tax=Arctium lappa TaxID=4217 RepID=A0ACB9FKJ8_ARCLA|nr:hypothetical protein L6452_02524 [Arctium lappa]